MLVVSEPPDKNENHAIMLIDNGVKDFNTIANRRKDFDTIIKITIPYHKSNSFEDIFIDEVFYKCLRSVLFHHRSNSYRASIPRRRQSLLVPPIASPPPLP